MSKHLNYSLSTNLSLLLIRKKHVSDKVCHLKKSLQKLEKSTGLYPISWLSPIGVCSFVFTHRCVFLKKEKKRKKERNILGSIHF